MPKPEPVRRRSCSADDSRNLLAALLRIAPRASRRLSAAVLLGCMLFCSTAWPSPATKADADPTPAAKADADPDAVRRNFDQGLLALRNRQLRDAIAAFRLVAGDSAMAERRSAALSLARYAQKLRDLGVSAPISDDPSAGRTTFVVSSTLAGAYTGIVILDLMDNNDGRVGAGVMLATTGIGLATSLLGSKTMRLTESTGDAYSLGLVWGLAGGALVGMGAQVQTSESTQLLMLLGMSGGAATGFLAARSLNPSRGQVNYIGTTSVLGVLTMGLAVMSIQPDNLSPSDTGWLLLGGLQAGTLAGIFTADSVDWSLSRSRLVFLGAMVGGLAGWGTSVLIAGDKASSRGMAGSTLVGLWAGVALSAWLTEDMTPDRGYRAAPRRSALVPTLMPDGSAGIAWAGRF